MNVDLCFVPEEHLAQESLPAVSGSSGRLVVPPPPAERPPAPGAVFGDETLSYEQAMRRYAEATRDRLHRTPAPPAPAPAVPSRWRERFAAQAERHRVREARRREDAAWREAKGTWRAWRERRRGFRALSPEERRASRAAFQEAEAAWQRTRAARQETLAQRQAENAAWHERVRALRGEDEGEERVWYAILVVVDNCTRQCLGLPLFPEGVHVTSAQVAAALAKVLPEELAFLISDQGPQFRTEAFAELARGQDFVHIAVYRHRPETNGIAERFVQTLKHDLCLQTWTGPEELAGHLAVFQAAYNDRPHQGVPLAGLSPNEYSRRLQLQNQECVQVQTD